MEYTYEFLRKCHGLRFRATICNKPQEGIIKVTSEGVILCYGEDDPGYLVTFGRRDTLTFSESTFAILPSDFEIVPRDPEKYTDWQVGDQLSYGTPSRIEVIFRFGKLVICVNTSDGYVHSFRTCRELFDKGYHLVLTDIEKQIIKERETAEWKPQNGDICFASVGRQKFIIIYGDSSYSLSNFSGKWELGKGYLWGYTSIRLATDEEKQWLFDALAKAGKRWNAEKKCVEDIPKQYAFEKGDPVLVRDFEQNAWELLVFVSKQENIEYPYVATDGFSETRWCHCIPYNKKTMHLLGTNNNYEEE